MSDIHSEEYKIRHEVEGMGGFYNDGPANPRQTWEDVIIETKKTSTGVKRVYKCPRCGSIVPKMAMYDDCMFCLQGLDWSNVKQLKKKK